MKIMLPMLKRYTNYEFCTANICLCCSAGVGRTGTYITLDHWMQFIHDHDFSNSIDIFKTVVEMRKCRMYMVQTE
jgi:protein tyrosine phosphatase